MADSLTYPAPKHGWTCFHCGETFRSPGSAENHFGKTPASIPGCLIKIQTGDERALLMALRDAENRAADYRHRMELAEVESEMLHGSNENLLRAAGNGIRSHHDLRMAVDSWRGLAITANALIERARQLYPNAYADVAQLPTEVTSNAQ